MRHLIAEREPQEAAFLLSLVACGTNGLEAFNGCDLEGARVTFRSQEIQKINSHSLLQATSLRKGRSNWIWPFLVSLTIYAVMAGECCDMFALVADREKQFPKHEKTCRNSLRNWICMSPKELRVQILCALLINLRERQQMGDTAAGAGQLAKGLTDDSSVVWDQYSSQ